MKYNKLLFQAIMKEDREEFFVEVGRGKLKRWKALPKFEILSPKLASGDTEQIYLCKEKATEKICIAKVMPSNLSASHHEVSPQIDKLTETLSALNVTPCIVGPRVRTENNIYSFLELCNCGSLAFQLQSQETFSESIIREVVKGMISLLDILHKNSYLHLRLDPSHILIHKESPGFFIYRLIGMQYVVDISKGVPKENIWTVGYNAPESISKVNYGFPSNIWSFGIIIYQMIVGKIPSEIDEMYVNKIRANDGVTFPRNVKISKELIDLIQRCLIYNPNERINLADIKNHPFVLEKSLDTSYQEIQASFIDINPKTGLSDNELLDLAKEDLGKLLEYLLSRNIGTETNFKVIKRDNLFPYKPLSDLPFAYGGFSELYQCENSETGEMVVRKVLNMGENNDVKAIELMISEVEIMLALKESTFTLELIDYFIYENNLNLIIEYCNGGNLHDYVKEVTKGKKLLPLDELSLIAWSIASGLYKMHSLKMMHRDIKPQNVLVIKDGERLSDVKLSDYGFGKKVDLKQSLVGHTILGTDDYFAPEMIEAIKQMTLGDEEVAGYDEKVDVWSYGILLYFLLFGKTPYESSGGGLGVVEKEDFKYPSYSPKYKPYVELIKKCLTLKPKDRPGFKEILKDPFLNTFYFQTRTSMSPYKLEKVISERGSTKVYEGKKKKDLYAIKVISIQAVDKEKIAIEASTLLKVYNCKNVVHLHDHFVYNNTLYLVMDHYAGGDLKKYIFERERKKKPLTSNEQIFVAFEILKGMKAIHSRNIIHRDICPENIVIKINAKSQEITSLALCDLGVSKVLSPDEGTTTVIGTYRSPELAHAYFKGEYGVATDIWSFGMTLYFILFGLDAHFVSGFSLSKLCNEGVMPLDEKKVPLVAKGLIEMMMSCLKKDPNERPSATTLLKNSIFSQAK